MLLLRKFHRFIVLPLFCFSFFYFTTYAANSIEKNLEQHKKALSLKPGAACAVFNHLSQQKNYPLKQVALLRKNLLCQIPLLKTPPHPPWAKHLAQLVQVKQLKQKKQWAEAFALEWKTSQPSEWHKRVHFYHELSKQYLTVSSNDPSLKKQTQDILFDLSPSQQPTPKDQQLFTVGNDFLRRRLFKEARQSYEKDFAQQKDLKKKSRALKAIAKSYKVERKLKDYIKHFQKQIDYLDRSAKGRYQVKYANKQKTLWAIALWTDGSPHQAIKVLKQISQHKWSSPYQKGYSFYVLGRIYLEQKKFQQAIKSFKTSLKYKITEELRDKVYWNIAWTALKINQKTRAMKNLAYAAQITKNPFSSSKFLFWQGAIETQLQPKKQIPESWKKLRRKHFFNYYHMLTYRLQKDPIPNFLHKKYLGQSYQDIHDFRDKKLKKLPPSQLKSQNLSLPNFLTLAPHLDQAGEKDLLESYLTYEKRRHKKMNKEKKFRLHYWYGKTNKPLKLFGYLHFLKTQDYLSYFQRWPMSVLPTPYFEVFKKQTSQANLPVELPLAIARQESAFNTFATSLADARGIMQLLPKVAKRIAEKSGLQQYTKAEDLFVPEINIPLGVLTLQRDFQKTSNLSLTAAAYNASPEKVLQWKKRYSTQDMIYFIEEIPYSETQGYVKLVIRNFIFYKMILNPNLVEIPFPKQFFTF